MRRQLTIWVIKGEIAVLMGVRQVLLWGLVKTRTRAMVKQAQREHYQDRLKAAMEAHPSNPRFKPITPTWIDDPPFYEADWEWDDEVRKRYMKDTREANPEDDR